MFAGRIKVIGGQHMARGLDVAQAYTILYAKLFVHFHQMYTTFMGKYRHLLIKMNYASMRSVSLLG